MTLLVTGATGFVMSVMARRWLQAHPGERVVALDRAPLDAAAEHYFAPVRARLDVVAADVTRPESFGALLDPLGITAIVHGATVTPISRGSATEALREPEAEAPLRIVDVNLMGTLHLAEWARTQPQLRRFLLVSSGSVYADHGPARPGEPLPEDGYVAPRKLYGISKLAAELALARYGELFGLSTVSVRLSSVYGTMDRATSSRTFRHVPNRLAHWALERHEPVRINTLDAVGDYIHAEDVADAVTALLERPRLGHAVYNVALGQAVPTRDVVDWAAEAVPGFRAEIAPSDLADIVQDATQTGGMWGAYDISRIIAETGWRPRPMRDAFLAYMDWIATEETHAGLTRPAGTTAAR